MNVDCFLIFQKTYEQNKLVEVILKLSQDKGSNPFASTMPRKICSYCDKRKNLKSFPKHSMYKDNLDARCRSCVKKHSKVRGKLHKKAPIKPEVCECCGKIPIQWCLDHDHSDDTFRGWICTKCNTGLGKLGDNLDGVIKAVNYLIMAKNRTLDNDKKN